jgi:glutamyl-tRNA synthetase
MLVPDALIGFDDLVRGTVRFAAANVPDYVLVRANGEPLYTLVNPVDDALMGVTHVLRGEDLLPSTPRQIVLYSALKQLGIGAGRTPRFGHLPTVLGEGNRRLSKRDKGSGLAEYRTQGYLPEALLNEQLVPFLVSAGLIKDPPLPGERALLIAATPLIQERINTLSEAVELLRFLFVEDEDLTIEQDAGLTNESTEVLDATIRALAEVEPYDSASIEAALRESLVTGLGMKPKVAFGPVRAAITGRRISPPLFESLELLGRRSALARLTAARARLVPEGARG